MGRARLGRFFLAAALPLLFASCPEAITPGIVDGARDATPPVISVSSPAEYSSYARTILIQGSVSDLAGPGKAGRVESLSYEILSHTAPKPASLASDGSFLVSEPNDLRENIVVLLKALDWNGNEAEYRLPLTYPGNEIPSFASAEGNRQTTLSWEDVPGVVSYTLYVEPSAKSPDPASSSAIAGVSSPFTLDSLRNGSLYSFLLEGTAADGRKNYSGVLRSMPLSTMHLFPRAVSYFNGVELSWRTLPAIQSYEVLRAGSPAGPWLSVSGPVSGPPFRDSGALRGSVYYYAVRPAAYSAVRSEWVEADADPVSSRSDAAVAAYAGVESAQASVWRGGYLYVADYYYGLRILNVSVPSIPIAAGKVAISSAKSVALSGDYAFVSGQKYVAPSWRKGVFVVDVADPAAPYVTGFAEVPDQGGLQAEGLAVLGDLVFMAGFNDGFAVVDVSDKAAPVARLWNQDKALLGQNYALAVQERGATDLLAVAGNASSALYAVSGTAASPVVTRVSSAVSGGRGLAFKGSVLAVAGTGGGWDLSAYETAVPSSPVLRDSVSPTAAVAGAESVEVAGDRAFVALRDYGYAVVDIADPANLATVRVQTVPGDAEHVAVGGGYAYVSSGTGYDLPIYGANDPSGARLVLTRTDVNAGARLAAYRGYLYVTEYYDAGSGYADWHAAAYNINAPASAYRAASNVSNYSPFEFRFAGARSYLASERSGIAALDLSSPGAPAYVAPGYVSLPGGYAWAVALDGHHALVGTSNSWLVSVDLSRPDSLNVVGSVQTQGTSGATREARGLAVRGGLAFVANEEAGLRVVDVADPTFPVALSGYGALPASGSAAALALAGDFVLVADSTNGLLVYDGATARNWSSAGQARIWPTTVSGGGAYDVVVRGNYAYVAKGASGLEIWDVSNPRSPAASGSLVQAGFSPVRLALYGEHLYALDGATKLYVVDLVP